MNEFIDTLIQSINMNKNEISNAGTRPLVSAIVQRAQDIVNAQSESTGVVVLAAPDSTLASQYFKGWKVEDFERLAIELENLKT
jgi:hypothetical protein